MNRTLRVIACVALTGCYTYRLVPLARLQPKDQVRVTARDGSRVELYNVTVANDTLLGRDARNRPIWQRSGGAIAVAVADVTTVAVRRVDVAGSVALSVLLVGTVAALVASAGGLWGGMSFGPWSGSVF